MMKLRSFEQGQIANQLPLPSIFGNIQFPLSPFRDWFPRMLIQDKEAYREGQRIACHSMLADGRMVGWLGKGHNSTTSYYLYMLARIWENKLHVVAATNQKWAGTYGAIPRYNRDAGRN